MRSLIRAELTKAATLPAVTLTMVAAVLAPPALALASGLSFRPADARWDAFPVESHGFETAGFGQPLVILLAAMVVGTEFTGDQLRTTLTAVPRRGRLLAAKLVLVAALAAAVGLVATSAAVVVKHAALGEHGLSPAEFTTAMAWNLLGVVVNYALIALIAAAVTVLTLSPVVTLVVLVPMVLGLTIGLVQAVPILRFLPDLAGVQLLTGYPGMGLLDPVPGGAVMAAWTAALVLAATLVFRRRDVAG